MKRLAIDSMIVDKIMNEPGLLQELQAAAARGALLFIAHHVLRDQLAATPDASDRAKLLATFEALPQVWLPTRGFVLDVSRLDEAALAGGWLDEVKTTGRGAMEDALIAATASGDAESSSPKIASLRKKATAAGVECEVWTFSDLLAFVRRA